MDPNEALKRIREAIKGRNRGYYWTTNEADPSNPIGVWDEIIEHFEALDEWLCKGGFMPAEWDEVKRDQEGE
jgi:hypothetical protein